MSSSQQITTADRRREIRRNEIDEKSMTQLMNDEADLRAAALIDSGEVFNNEHDQRTTLSSDYRQYIDAPCIFSVWNDTKKTWREFVAQRGPEDLWEGAIYFLKIDYDGVGTLMQTLQRLGCNWDWRKDVKRWYLPATHINNLRQVPDYMYPADIVQRIRLEDEQEIMAV